MKLDHIIVCQNREGEDYRQQHPTKEAARSWRYITTRNIFYKIPGIVPVGQVLSFFDAKDREWLRIDWLGVTVMKDYAWNGCTPKRWFPLFGWMGTPDFDSTIYASLIHDALYQFHHTEHFPLHRSDCDLIFRRVIEQQDSDFIALTYYKAVRRFGSWNGKGNGERSTLTNIPRAIIVT